MAELTFSDVITILRDASIDVTHTGAPQSHALTDCTADSRKTKPNTIFVALKGLSVDGRDFIPKAVENGATVIITDKNPHAVPNTIAVIETPSPHAAYIALLNAFYPHKPKHLLAVTGTNGKTSVATFVQQLLTKAGQTAASIGTLGLMTADGLTKGALTTPDPYTLYSTIDALARNGTDTIIMEASSHGLHQGRLAGVKFDAAAFTNLSRDHLDYHKTLEDYRAAKHLLFTDYLKENAKAICYDDGTGYEADRLEAVCQKEGHTLTRIGVISATNAAKREAFEITLHSVAIKGLTQQVRISGARGAAVVKCPLPGAFQIENLLTALALITATGVPMERILGHISTLGGIPGRMELIGQTQTGAAVFVDFAHTPDGLETALKALRPHIKEGAKLHVLFGAGGDRDAGKRPEMGRIAERYADVAIVTDDNPRSEDPSAIRAAILSAMSHPTEIADRAAAISTAVSALKANDVLLIAGKGHEEGQILKDKTIPFSDQKHAQNAIAATKGGR